MVRALALEVAGKSVAEHRDRLLAGGPFGRQARQSGSCPGGRGSSDLMARPRKYPDELIQRGIRLALESERPDRAHRR
jgi:hypothetical protein